MSASDAMCSSGTPFARSTSSASSAESAWSAVESAVPSSVAANARRTGTPHTYPSVTGYRLAALHINFGFLPGALVGDAIGVGGGCFGATIALRREVLERIGGFGRLRNELADDHRMGSAVRGLGLKVALSPYVVENRVSEPSLASLWRHELRWARTSRAMAPSGFAGSVITHTTVLAVLAALAIGTSLAWGAAAAALLLRWWWAAATARWLDLPRHGLWLLPLRDVLSFAVFLGSFCGRSVSWRNQLFRVEPGGQMSLEGDKPV